MVAAEGVTGYQADWTVLSSWSGAAAFLMLTIVGIIAKVLQYYSRYCPIDIGKAGV